MTAFVAGATGYVGKAVVAELRRRHVDTVAHVRPDSSRLADYVALFEPLGASVDTTAWDEDAIAATFARLEPTLVFGCIGTTQARKRASEDPNAESYEAIDYGLTAMLIRAAAALPTPPRFVYLSSAGVGPSSPSSYIKARWKAESDLRESGLPFTIVRPAVISGTDRGEDRPGERAAAVLGDALLGVAAAVGMKKLRDKWASITAPQLAAAMVDLATTDRGLNAVVDPSGLR